MCHTLIFAQVMRHPYECVYGSAHLRVKYRVSMVKSMWIELYKLVSEMFTDVHIP